MIIKPKNIRSAVDLATIDLYEKIQSLTAATENSRAFYQLAEQADLLLESMPFSTSVFDLAKRRLANAKRYVDSDESGAAKFELRLLAGSIRPGLKPDLTVPIQSEKPAIDSYSPIETPRLPGPPVGFLKTRIKNETNSARNLQRVS